MILAQNSSDPYASYFEVEDSKGKGKGHNKSPVPEPAEWGLIFVGCAMLVVLWVRVNRARTT